MPVATIDSSGAIEPVYGAIDAGGTKFLCAIGRSPTDIAKITSITTRSPEATLAEVGHFFGAWREAGHPLAAIGIAAFGPLNRDPAAPGYGRLNNSPKPGWTNADIAGTLSRHIDLPIGIDTDVNGAALAEGRWGAACGASHYAYVTVGTGIGVGIVADGRLVNGIAHPELGHYRPPRHSKDDFAGTCPFHGDCLEGLACGPAIAARCGNMQAVADLADDDAIWPIIAHYLAHLCTILIFACAPERIVLGGGVMRRNTLFEMIRGEARKMLGGYLQRPLHAGRLDELIVPSAWCDVPDGGINAGAAGGFILAAQAARQNAG